MFPSVILAMTKNKDRDYNEREGERKEKGSRAIKYLNAVPAARKRHTTCNQRKNLYEVLSSWL